MLTKAENHQLAVIAALVATGHNSIAQRLARCQRARRHRQSGWPWRCHSAGCWACRRTTIRRWWRGFQIWLDQDDGDISLALIPINGDLIGFTRRLRKGLRDLRDRSARHDHHWQSVAMAGLVDGDRALILIRHPGIARAEVWARLARRWPEIALCNPEKFEPSYQMAVANAVALARCRRGIEPTRIVVMPQVAATLSLSEGEPMPMLI
jgi:hypothetical protein